MADAGPGTLVLFRVATRAPAKHCGILTEANPHPAFIHAYEGAGVVIHPYSAIWARRARFVFLFPG